MNDPRLRVLDEASAAAAEYVAGLAERRVAPPPQDLAGLELLGGPLPEDPSDPVETVRLLHDYGSPATVASAGPRYFGFVTGGTLPAALGAAVLAAAWDQNAALEIMSPAAAAVEATAAQWILAALRLPAGSAVGFTTGATVANFTALAAARHAVLEEADWDVGERGLFGAPRITVVAGEEVHVTVLKALSLLGFGRAAMVRVPTDAQGRMRVDAFPRLDGPSIVCLQAGNVNTGAFDPLRELSERAHEGGAWVHVDGAFGLWARAAPSLASLADGAELADSWATDGHKWLNVPYDSGFAIVRDGRRLESALALSAAYLGKGPRRDGSAFVPEFSRRARGLEAWAALRSLGQRGLAELIERNVRLAGRFAGAMRNAGYEILAGVVLNQVLVSFGSAERTKRVIEEVQREGTAWCGGTVWQGRTAMRFSVSSWATTERDIDHTVEAVLRIAKDIG